MTLKAANPGTYNLTYYASDGLYHSSPVVPPSKVAGLTVVSVTYNSVSLSWAAAAQGTNPLAGYYVYRGGVQLVALVGTTYTDLGLSSPVSYTYTVAAYDTGGTIGAASDPMSGTTTFAITTVSLSATTRNQFYTQTLSAQGGIAPLTWSLAAATGTNKWTVSPGGALSGTPTNAETDILTVRVTDNAGNVRTQALNVVVNAVGVGSLVHGSAFTVTGSGFGTKPLAAPLLYDDGSASSITQLFSGTLIAPLNLAAHCNMQMRPTPFTMSTAATDYTFPGNANAGSSTWQANHAYVIGDTINAGGGLYTCAVSGTSGAVQPTFNGASTTSYGGSATDSVTYTTSTGTSVVTVKDTGITPGTNGVNIPLAVGGYSNHYNYGAPTTNYKTVLNGVTIGGLLQIVSVVDAQTYTVVGSGTASASSPVTPTSVTKYYLAGVADGSVLWKFSPFQTDGGVTSSLVRSTRIIGGNPMSASQNDNTKYNAGLSFTMLKPKDGGGTVLPHTVYLRWKQRVGQNWDRYGASVSMDDNWKFFWLAEGLNWLGTSGGQFYYGSRVNSLYPFGNGPGANDEFTPNVFNNPANSTAVNASFTAGTGWNSANIPGIDSRSQWVTVEVWMRRHDPGNSHLYLSINQKYTSGVDSKPGIDFAYVTSSLYANFVFGPYMRSINAPSNWSFFDDTYGELVETGTETGSAVWFLTDSALWSTSSLYAVQFYQTYTDGSITFKCQGGELPIGGTVYLHKRKAPWLTNSDAAFSGPFTLSN